MPASSTELAMAPVNLKTPLRQLPLAHPVVVDPAASLRETLKLIDARASDVAVVVDQASAVPLGIVTLRDAVRALADESAELDQPVAFVMTGGLASLSADATIHQATLLMLRRGMRHLILVEGDGRLYNVVSQGELYGMRAVDSAQIAESILAARSVSELIGQTLAVRRFAARRLAEGSGPETLCEWISALNDLIALQVIDIVEGNFDLPYVPWCWLVFGSEGRLEQTLVTDQDNGIVFLAASGEADALREHFLPFAKAVNEALDACGFPKCGGGIMAGNPLWCLSTDEWRQRFGAWIAVPEPEALLKAGMFFDFRPLYGREDLAVDLQRWLSGRVCGDPQFLRAMAANALVQEPPLGWWSDFRLGGGTKFPNTIDLKGQGIRLFVDALRVYALGRGIDATNTVERLRSLRGVMGMPDGESAALAAAFYQLQRLRLWNQVTPEFPDAGNRLNPDRLHRLDRQLLKEALLQARALQRRLRMDYLE